VRPVDNLKLSSIGAIDAGQGRKLRSLKIVRENCVVARIGAADWNADDGFENWNGEDPNANFTVLWTVGDLFAAPVSG
jgi:hypothetical protein